MGSKTPMFAAALFTISESCSVMSDSLQSHGLYRPWNSPGQNTGVGSLFLPPGDLPNPGIKPRSPASKADSLPAEPQGKPKNIGVGSLSLPQWIFLTQESNWGLLHYSRILYQLSYQGSPLFTIAKEKKQPKCLRWMNRSINVISTHNGIYSTLERNEILIHSTA